MQKKSRMQHVNVPIAHSDMRVYLLALHITFDSYDDHVNQCPK